MANERRKKKKKKKKKKEKKKKSDSIKRTIAFLPVARCLQLPKHSIKLSESEEH